MRVSAVTWDGVRWNTPSGTLLPLASGVDYSLVLQQPLSAAISCGAACSDFRGTPCARPAANPRFLWSHAHGWARPQMVASSPPAQRCNISRTAREAGAPAGRPATVSRIRAAPA
ncbi:hypothetical protein GCM10007977_089500 [Dactylosporangium sucinum]|uniref:Uncharacterized protein n=1 Tax=Dactylosporangium sucinum TaxID=1424081 RepID=A0A917UB82_9ACTN|nr:hypothetical protein GCM10007977_089500 [Dactylosporangium sucinum]